MDVGKRLIELRKRCRLTQNGLADRAGVSQTHLRRVELGQADITVGHLQLLLGPRPAHCPRRRGTQPTLTPPKHSVIKFWF